MADQVTRRLLNILLGLSRPTIALYPVQTGAPAGGVTIAAQAGAWTAAYVDIIAAAAITVDFWLLQLQYDLVGAVTELFDVRVQNVTLTAVVYEDKLDTTAVEANVGPTTMPYPVYCAPNTQVGGITGAVAATDINVSLLTATGL